MASLKAKKMVHTAFYTAKSTGKGTMVKSKQNKQGVIAQHPSKLKTTPADKTNARPKDESITVRTLWNLVPPLPLVASTVYQHYAKGPPAKSWSLTLDLVIAIVRDFLERSNTRTVEELQLLTTTRKLPLSPSTKRIKFTIPQLYRERAGRTLSRQFSKEDLHRIGWDWQKDREQSADLRGEWLESPTSKDTTILFLHGGAYYLGCYGLYRQFLSRLLKKAEARTVAVDYRLAPQHPFPAAVEDALAAYLYLIDPPPEAGILPIDPKKIVVAGDSAGGGLTFALLLAIRDAGLPAPAGAMTLSPWLDLTHSLPSIISNVSTDYLPAIGFRHAPSPALDYSRLPQCQHGSQEALVSLGPLSDAVPICHLEREDMDRIQFYAGNDALKMPMVSPLFDKRKLQNLPRMLIQAGTAERLRDEALYATMQATNQYPSEHGTVSDTATSVTLELYADQPHVFQLILPTVAATKAVERLAAFVRQVTHPDDVTADAPLLRIRSVSPRGAVKDITQETVRDTAKQWDDWEAKLARTSLKERMADVHEAYTRADQTQKKNLLLSLFAPDSK